jgi:hypothetical protein
MNGPLAAETRERARVCSARLRAWLAAGDIQSPDGAFCAWREEAGPLAFEYPEITGYALTWLAAQDEPTDEEKSAGERAAHWLLVRLQDGPLPAHAGFDDGAVYTFDLGMIASGLISFGRRYELGELVKGGEALAKRLGELFIEEREPPALDPSGPPSTRAPAWSNGPNPHIAKCVQAMLLADERRAAERLIAHAAASQDAAGYYRTQEQADLVMLHPHLYTVEAMWMWGTAREDEVAIEGARRATEWAWSHQLPDGGLPRLVALGDDRPEPVEQLDVTAQAVRAALLVDAEVDGLSRAVERLCTLARPVGGGAALPYQPRSGQRHLNAWVTMFGAQALTLAAAEQPALMWHELV